MPALKFQFPGGLSANVAQVNVLDYIPFSLHKSIADQSITTELTSYIEAAIAGVSNQVIKFPGGKYPLRDVNVLNSSSCLGLLSDGDALIVLATGATSSTNAFIIEKDDFIISGFRSSFATSTHPTNAPAASSFVRHLGTSGSRLRITNCHHIGGHTFCYLDGEVDEVWITDNVIEGTWTDAIDVISGVNVHVDRNKIITGGFSTAATSGAIRTAPTVLGSRPSRNLSITNNIIRQFALFGQSAIDCYASGAENISIVNNTVDGCGSGIEVKTDDTVLSPDTYQHIKISGNRFNCSLLGTSYVAIALNSTTASLASGKAGRVMISDNHIVGDGASIGSSNFYGISANVYFSTTIIANSIEGVSRGIAVAPTNSGDMNDLCIESNIVRCTGIGIHLTQAGATFNRPHVRNNDVVSGSEAFVCTNAAFDDALVQGNSFHSTGDDACELRNMSDSLVTGNVFVSDTGVAILGQAVALTNVTFSNNDLTTLADNAMNLGVGTGIIIRDNHVSVPVANRTIVGAATYVASNNRRNIIILGDPTATYAASVGDVFPVSQPGNNAVKEYQCVVAGGVGGATFNAVMLQALTAANVTQNTNKSTAVTANGIRGDITMNAANLVAGDMVTFTFNNSFMTANDFVGLVHHNVGTASAYLIQPTVVTNGSCVIAVRNITGGDLAEAIVIRYRLFRPPQ